MGVLGCSPSVTEESTAAMAGEGMGGVGVGSHVSQVNGVGTIGKKLNLTHFQINHSLHHFSLISYAVVSGSLDVHYYIL